MKSKYYLLGLPLVALLAASCGQRSSSPESIDGIDEFEICQKLMSGQKDYKVETDYGTVYLELMTSIQWPEKMGSANLSVLQDSIKRIAFRDRTSDGIREVLKNFIANTSIVDGATYVEPVDSLPADSMTYFYSVTADITDLTEDLVTYQVIASSFLGGAHPMTATRPFTYNLNEGVVLTNDNIYLPGVTNDSIMPVIKEALARQLSVPVRSLDRTGIFVSQFTYPGRPYIVNNTLYFHYDPYEIGPYALGNIDVAVHPYSIDHFLKPEVRKLFDQEF